MSHSILRLGHLFVIATVRNGDDIFAQVSELISKSKSSAKSR